MAAPAPSARTTVRRLPARAAYERATIDAILDEAVFCHLGSAASRMLRTLAEGVPVCATATLLDGLVLARSAFHHSLNYRSVVILGTAAEVTDPAERLAALEAIVEHVVPGRWREVRGPTERELKLTKVLSLPSPRRRRRCGPVGRSTTRRTSGGRAGRACCRSASCRWYPCPMRAWRQGSPSRPRSPIAGASHALLLRIAHRLDSPLRDR